MRIFVIVVAIGVVAIAATTIAVATRQKAHIWMPASNGNIAVNNVSFPDGRLYRNPALNGIMVYLEPNRIYVVRPSEGTVGFTGQHYFWFITRFGAVSKESADPSINMMHPKMNKTDPQLQLQARSASFRDFEGRKVKINW